MATIILLEACLIWQWRLAKSICILLEVIFIAFGLKAVVGLLLLALHSRRSYSQLLFFLRGLLLVAETVHNLCFNMLDELLGAQDCILIDLLRVATVLRLLRTLLIT